MISRKTLQLLNRSPFKLPGAFFGYPKLVRQALERADLTMGAQGVATADNKALAPVQREDSLEHLERQIADLDLPREAYEWYLDIRRFGSFPHSGFGLGIERCVAWLCGVPHLRETSPYPRMLNRLYP